jgi:hypothetical protein
MLESIKNDNLAMFKEDFSYSIEHGSVYFGAYSLLSILYIYHAIIILNFYEDFLIDNFFNKKITFDEEIEIDEKFSNIAKTNYRKYIKAEEISPVEVLLLQGKNKKAMKLSKKLYLSFEQQNRINSMPNCKFCASKTLELNPEEFWKKHYLDKKFLLYFYDKNGCFDYVEKRFSFIKKCVIISFLVCVILGMIIASNTFLRPVNKSLVPFFIIILIVCVITIIAVVKSGKLINIDHDIEKEEIEKCFKENKLPEHYQSYKYTFIKFCLLNMFVDEDKILEKINKTQK